MKKVKKIDSKIKEIGNIERSGSSIEKIVFEGNRLIRRFPKLQKLRPYLLVAHFIVVSFISLSVIKLAIEGFNISIKLVNITTVLFIAYSIVMRALKYMILSVQNQVVVKDDHVVQYKIYNDKKRERIKFIYTEESNVIISLEPGILMDKANIIMNKDEI